MRDVTALFCCAVMLTGCAEPPEPPEPQAAAPQAGGVIERSAENEALMGKWSRSCALCHVDGTGGAPRMGSSEEWADRVAQGEDVLFAHTLEGYRNMPPLGYCMSCSGDDFRALIRFMTRMPAVDKGRT